MVFFSVDLYALHIFLLIYVSPHHLLQNGYLSAVSLPHSPGKEAITS